MSDITNEETLNSKATKITIGINLLGVLIAVWMVAYPEPYWLATTSGMLFPLLYMVIVVLYKGLIRFNTSSFAFIACSLVLMIRAVKDFEILDYERLWISVSLLTIFLMASLITLSSEFSFKTKGGLVIILSSLFIFLYSFGLYTLSNCLFDQSKARTFTTSIANKQITNGTKSTTYHLYLNAWGSKEGKDHVTVTADQYDTSTIGDNVDIELKSGWLGTPWYSISIQ
ncbi:MAG: hypothetical protein ABI663_13720 [Chryseolinea sp.]